MTQGFKSVLLAPFLMTLMSGCSVFPETQPLPMYTLNASESIQIDEGPVEASFIIDRPQAPGRLDSKRIVIRQGDHREDVIANGQWADNLTKLLQDQLIAAFENSGEVKTASRPEAGVASAYVLQSNLQDFSAQDLDGKITIHIRLVLRLLDAGSRQTLRTKTVDITQDAESASVEGIVGAFNKGLETILKDAVTWSIEWIPD